MALNEKFVIKGPVPRVCLPSITLGQAIYNSLCGVDREHVALLDRSTGEKMSYGEMLDMSMNLADALRITGYSGQETILGLCSENSVYFNVPMVAAMFTCTVMTPLNPAYTVHELTHALNISRPKVVFCSQSTYEKLLTLKKTLPFIEKLILLGTKSDGEGYQCLESFINTSLRGRIVESYDFKPTDADSSKAVAFIMWSSGTTGLPKGVMLSHRNLMVRMTHSRDPRYAAAIKNWTFIILPMFHAFGMMLTLESFLVHKTVISMNRFDEDLFLRTIQDFKISSMYLAPPLAIFLSKTPKIQLYDLSCLEEVICGAAPLSKATEAEIMRRFPNLTMSQGYGLTESTMAVVKVTAEKVKHGSVGHVMSYMQLTVRHPETGEVLGPHQVGEICLKGPMLMLGYYKNPAATKETITSDGWLKSGDLGYFDEDEVIYIIDRLKELIKFKGFQVAPAELEALLVNHPKIKDAGVVGLPDDLVGERPLAFLVKKEGEDVSEKEIQQYVADLMSPQKRLSGGVIFVESIPKNPSGKILRKDLRNMLKQYDIQPIVDSKI